MDKIKICEILRETFDSLHREGEEGEFPVYAVDLQGYCGVAAWYLALLFRRYGHEAKVIYGIFGDSPWDVDHCWVRSGKKFYDITATQFGLNPIEIWSPNDEIYHQYWGHRYYNRTSDFVKHKWQSGYRPTRRVGRVILNRFEKIAQEKGYL